MDEPVRAELQRIYRSIADDGRSLEERGATESDDEFQTEHLCGGYGADEGAFCFSYYDG